jgi:hypothetical protein
MITKSTSSTQNTIPEKLIHRLIRNFLQKVLLHRTHIVSPVQTRGKVHESEYLVIYFVYKLLKANGYKISYLKIGKLWYHEKAKKIYATKIKQAKEIFLSAYKDDKELQQKREKVVFFSFDNISTKLQFPN